MDQNFNKMFDFWDSFCGSHFILAYFVQNVYKS